MFYLFNVQYGINYSNVVYALYRYSKCSHSNRMLVIFFLHHSHDSFICRKMHNLCCTDDFIKLLNAVFSSKDVESCTKNILIPSVLTSLHCYF